MYHQQQRYLPPIDVPDKHHNGAKSYRNNFADPSEPIYTDPSLFERYIKRLQISFDHGGMRKEVQI